PRAAVNVHIGACGPGVLPRPLHRLRADVEGGHLGRTGCRRAQRHHPAAGAQVRDPGPWQHAGCGRGVDEEPRILLRGIDLDRDVWGVELGICARHGVFNAHLPDGQTFAEPVGGNPADMSICDTCGNDYDKAFTVTRHDGHTATFDSVECAAA